MSDEASEAPKTRPILKIILLVILALVVQAAVVFGTLFAAGFFDSPADAEECYHCNGKSQKNSDNLDDIVDSDEPQGSAEGGRVYFEIKPELLTNLYNSQRLLQLKVAVMVKENDEQTLVEEIKEHAFPIRSRLLEILSEKREDQASTLGYRAVLAAELKVAMNDVLEEHLGGRHVEEIYFTEFIVQ